MQKALTLTVSLIILLSLCLTNFNLFGCCQEAEYEINVKITSPIQNKTYYSHSVPLNFTFSTSINESRTKVVVFVYNLDGQLGYHGGQGTRIGAVYPPLSSSYSTTMNIPSGYHLLWVQANYYLNDNSIYGPLISLSQIVNFTVSTTTPYTPTTGDLILLPSVSASPTIAIPTINEGPHLPENNFATIYAIIMTVIVLSVLGLYLRDKMKNKQNI